MNPNQDEYNGRSTTESLHTNDLVLQQNPPPKRSDAVRVYQPPITSFLQQRQLDVDMEETEVFGGSSKSMNHSERGRVLGDSPPLATEGIADAEMRENECNTIEFVFLSEPTVEITPTAPSSKETILKKRKMKQSSVWQHFKKSSVQNSSECNFCHNRFQTVNATNVKRHLRICNHDAWKLVEEKDKSLTSSESAKLQPLTSVSFTKFYPRNHPKQLNFRRKLAFLAGATTIPKRVLQTPEFKDLIYAADPKLRIPNYSTVNLDIKKLVAVCKNQMRQLIKTARRLTLSSDIWTKKGQTSSYLGVIATFFQPNINRKVQLVLSVRKFESVTHTAEDIIREMKHVITIFDIKPGQVWRGMTDGASNMICSHRSRETFFHQNVVAPSTQFPDISEDLQEYGSDECISDVESLHEEVSESRGLSVDAVETLNLNKEMQLNGSYSRLTCFVHTLLRCLSVCETSEHAKKIHPIINKVKLVVGKFKKSHVLTETLIEKSSVGLISFCETRWNYIYNAFSRLVSVKIGVTETLTKFKKEKFLLQNNEWEEAEKLTVFLKPFSDCTFNNSKEKDVVSSEVIVTIIHLYMHLDKYEKDDLLDELSKSIKEKMKEKFSRWFHDKLEQPLEGTYLAATLLDPRVRLILPEEQLKLAKKSIIKEFSLMLSEIPSNSTQSISESSQQAIIKPSRFPFLSEIKSSILRSRSNSSTNGLDQFKKELDKYLNSESFDEVDESCNVFDFWVGISPEFPLLSPIALDYLSIPSSTSNVECMFSTAGGLSSSKRCNLEGENLEDEVLLSKNKSLLAEISKLEDFKHLV